MRPVSRGRECCEVGIELNIDERKMIPPHELMASPVAGGAIYAIP